MKKILITGATGLLGPYLVSEASRYGKVVTTSKSGGDIPLDLLDRSKLSELVGDNSPDWVIYAAGLTDVDYCERWPIISTEVNSHAVKNLVDALTPSTQLLLISTDQVYPDETGPHDETKVGPINVYGKTKLLGEEYALQHPQSIIARTNFFGPSVTRGRSSFDDFVATKLRNEEKITLFSDLLFSPLHMSTLSKALCELLDRKISGIFNIGSRRGMSKAEFGLAVSNHLSLSASTVTIGSSTTVAGRCPRAKDLRLNVSKLETVLRRKMPTLIEEISKL